MKNPNHRPKIEIADALRGTYGSPNPSLLSRPPEGVKTPPKNSVINAQRITGLRGYKRTPYAPEIALKRTKRALDLTGVPSGTCMAKKVCFTDVLLSRKGGGKYSWFSVPKLQIMGPNYLSTNQRVKSCQAVWCKTANS